MDAELSTVFIIAGEQTTHASLGRFLVKAGLRTESYESAEEFLQGFDSARHANGLICALVNVELTDMTGLQLQARLRAKQINLPIVFLADVGDISQCVRAMKAGAVDFLEKPYWEAHLLRSVSEALARYEHSRQDNLRRETLKQRVAQLTRREREIMAQLVSGEPSISSEQIAERLHISRRTVEHHRAAIREKMHAHSLLELVDMARVCGFH
ncbi:MAG: response regulator transcription factor [Pseudomonadales bacterium]